MDAHDLFRRLGAGAKFDVRRFSADAARFKIGKRKYDFGSSEVLQGLDFFGNKKSVTGECEASRTHQELQDEEKNEESLTERKREQNKKKRKKVTSEITSQEVSTIQWISSVEAKIEDKKVKRENKLTSGKLEQLRKEKINFFRNKHKIHVQGTDLPDPIATFQQLDQEFKINSRLLQNILDAGFQIPTPIQMQAIPVMLHGRELLASAPTGSGKTLAFSIPILMQLKQPTNKGFRALIISPTRELASQIHRELVKISEGTGFRIHMIHKATVAAKKFGPKSSKKFDILVTTPNRLIYLLKQDPPGIDLTSVEWLVVDESDKLFEDGKTGFRDQLASIFLACTSHKVRRALFSATFAYDVEQWCRLNLDNVITVSIGARNSAVETVEQELLFVGSETGKLLAMRELVKKSIERAKELFHELIYEGINVDVIHADRTQQQRDNTVHSFRAGKIWVLICTALLARGIDFKGVNLVINYDFPTSSVEYIHRIGRTGRAGHKGKAVTFFTEDDKPLLRSVANVIQQAGCPVPEYIKGFQKLLSKQKKKMIKKPLERESISTTPKYFLEKAKDKRSSWVTDQWIGRERCPAWSPYLSH
ncbi:probable ATP-dependent RNA helicase DDX52 isoform X4 [Physeter macrocephalus]|uniref:Probable ATP-dependent RNA helicase DDX52 n=1 Tax=Physeter macrocephalus TaxID=9755 RepID=A0A2Y9EYT6_PHYMC|nr:probable ATP-dependent RNA helicase DDX52 isoform X4 [Physeter catodon]|eukprot:XP_007110593.1 probable ATP-dependent RNA helicase DDX52 isoform X4 [Physeter catodon]